MTKARRLAQQLVMPRRLFSRLRSLPAVAALAVLMAAPTEASPVATALPATLSQGGLVVVQLKPGSNLDVGGKQVHVGEDGIAVFGAGRDEQGPIVVTLTEPDGHRQTARIAITPRDWPIERVNGVPAATVNPPPELVTRIQREQAAVTAVRKRDDDREDFLAGFQWPVRGRISGRFGNQRIYNGDPKAPHSGMDIAVPQGTPVRAPAAGIVTYAQPDLYLTGGTIVLDHGFGLSSNFLHLSRLEVNVGQHVTQGQVIALSGMTGRATGPHLHWGFNWFGVRLDPLLLPGIDGAN
jgi:murein DD-endopeptidase MepM/ murein hydrolase activator NlpD